MSLQDFFGRSIDLQLLQGGRSSGSVQLQPAVQGAKVCTGVEKLSQKVAVLLLTDVGSVYGNPRRGTDFLPAVKRGQLSTEADVASQFGAAAVDILNQLNASAPDDLPDDERLVDLELDDVAVSGDLLSLAVRLVTADPKRPVILAVDVPVR